MQLRPIAALDNLKNYVYRLIERCTKARGAQLLMATLVVFVLAPTAASSQTARTPWGDPDLQGTWTNFDLGEGYSLEAPAPVGRRPARLLGGTGTCIPSSEPLPESNPEAAFFVIPDHLFETARDTGKVRPSLISEPADGRLPPLTEAGDQRIDSICQKVFESHVYLDPWVRCLTRGIPASTFPSLYNNAYQILQVPGYVVIRYEMIHDARIIRLDDRSPTDSDIRLWMGDARGHWDGNTLVVETANFNDRSSIRGHAHSEHLTVTERFTRVGADGLDYEAIVDDPQTWVTPWTVAIGMTRFDEYAMYEYACHEGNQSAMVGILRGARAEERSR